MKSRLPVIKLSSPALNASDKPGLFCRSIKSPRFEFFLPPHACTTPLSVLVVAELTGEIQTGHLVFLLWTSFPPPGLVPVWFLVMSCTDIPCGHLSDTQLPIPRWMVDLSYVAGKSTLALGHLVPSNMGGILSTGIVSISRNKVSCEHHPLAWLQCPANGLWSK